eukprot:1141969-Pelagomonas_calceolata.AAC.5
MEGHQTSSHKIQQAHRVQYVSLQGRDAPPMGAWRAGKAPPHTSAAHRGKGQIEKVLNCFRAVGNLQCHKAPPAGVWHAGKAPTQTSAVHRQRTNGKVLNGSSMCCIMSTPKTQVQSTGRAMPHTSAARRC